jgi:hypothetical protein
MGEYIPSQEEWNNPKLYKKNMEKRMRRLAIMMAIVKAVTLIAIIIMMIYFHG